MAQIGYFLAVETITLYTAPQTAWGLRSFSPFVTKLEAWLRLAGVPYLVRAGNPMKAPKGKIPFIELDGRLIGDSQIIIDTLAARLGDPVDGWMDAQQRAVAHAVRRMLEEGLYFFSLRMRWVEEDGWAQLYPAFSPMMPLLVRPMAMAMVRSKVRSAALAQGAGRHTRDELEALCVRDVESLAQILGDKPFLVGDRPCTADCTAMAFIWGNTAFPVENAVSRRMKSDPRLMAYLARMRERCFPQELARPDQGSM